MYGHTSAARPSTWRSRTYSPVWSTAPTADSTWCSAGRRRCGRISTTSGAPPTASGGKDACTPHQIREADLKQIVLDDLRRVTHFARMKERQFAEYINQKNTMELRREINRVQKELDAMRRRDGELSALFKRLYEDNVLGRVTNEQFRMLSADYNGEQKELESAIPAKEEQLERLKASVANVDAFIEKAKQYTAIDELTPQLLRLFIQRIEIGGAVEETLPLRWPERSDRVPGHRRAGHAHAGGRPRTAHDQRNYRERSNHPIAGMKTQRRTVSAVRLCA